MDFSKKLKMLREAARLSQKDLAEKSNVSQQAISAIEKGDRSPTEMSMDMLSAALGYTLVELLSYGEKNPSEFDVLTYDERELVRCFRVINADSKKTVMDLVATYAENPAKQEGHIRQTGT